jgi:hypothetical protein
MIDFAHLLSVIESVLGPEEYQKYLARLSAEMEANPFQDGQYYFNFGEADKKRNL